MNGLSLNQLLKGFCNELEFDVFIHRLQTDSRKIRPGDLFIAYPGRRVDGRHYIKEAIEKQVVGVLYEADHYEPSVQNGIPLIAFPNLQNHIGDIATRFYGDPSKTIKVIGVTGTNGKTSCTHFIAQSLQSQKISCGVIGTLGYGFVGNLNRTNCTTPDPIQLQQAFAKLQEQDVKAVAMEVSSHALDQFRVQGVHFTIAVFTQLSQEHLDYHSNMENYARAKELLFEQPGLHYGVVNCDDALGRRIIDNYHSKLTLVGYSADGIKDNRVSYVRATHIKKLAHGFSVDVQTSWGKGTFTISLLGRFNISNLLSVLSVLCLYGVPFEEALTELSKLNTVRGRMQVVNIRHHQHHCPQIIVDYAHTPDALKKVLMALREHCKGQLICVFGCGGNRDRRKRPQMAAIAEKLTNQIVLTNDNPRSESPLAIIRDIQAGFKNKNSVIVETDRAKAIKYAVQKATSNDTVLIAGKGHETTQIIGTDVLPFDDVEEVRKVFNS